MLAQNIRAQDNAMLLYGDHFNLNSSRVMPAKLGTDFSTFQLSLFYYHIWLANNSFTSNNFFGKGTSTELIEKAINDLNGTNRMYFGQDLQPIALAFKIRKNKTDVVKKDIINFALGITEQISIGFVFSENFMQLAWNGNKQFAGKEVELGPLSFNALYNREYFLAYALPVVSNEKFDFRIGGRFKFIQGINGIYMPKYDAKFYTDPEGKFIEVKPDFEINTSGIKRDFSVEDLFAFNGKGVGVDFGTSFIFTKRAYLNLSVLDMGMVKFNKQTRHIENSTPINYEGVIFNGLFGGEFNLESDSLSEILNSVIIEGNTFKMPLSTRLILQFEYRTPMITRKGKIYDSNAFFITYIQGFRDLPKSTTKPYFGIAYSHNFNSTFNIGANIGYGGTNKLTLGTFFSVRAGVLRIGFGSGNLSGLFAKKRGTGVDGTFSLTFASKK